MTEETPRSSRLRVLAWALFGLAALTITSGLVLGAVLFVRGTLDRSMVWGVLSFLAPAITFSVVGLIVALRRPGNPAGWFMLVIGAFWSVLVLPLGSGWSPQWFGNMIWVLPLGLMGTHLLLRLPDGRLPSPRWRWVSRAATLAIVLAGVAVPPVDGASNTSAVQGFVGATGLFLLLGCVLASVASPIRPSAEGGRRRTSPAAMDRGGGRDVHRVLCDLVRAWGTGRRR